MPRPSLQDSYTHHMSEIPLGLRSYATYATLTGTGRPFPMPQIIAAIRTHPVDGVLGALQLLWQRQRTGADPHRFERDLLREMVNGPQFHSVRETLDASLQAPGPVFHPHAAAYLTHLTLLHSRRDIETPTLNHAMLGTVAWMLVMLADHLADSPPLSSPPTWLDRKRYALGLLRIMQFQESPSHDYVQQRVSRYAHIYTTELGKLPLPFNPGQVFEEATGVSLPAYFATLGVLLAWFDRWARQGAQAAQWFTIDDLLRAVPTTHHHAARTLLHLWSTTPADYASRVAEWVEARQGALVETFDFVALKARPIVEVHPGIFTVPVYHFLTEVAVNGPHFIILNALSEKEKAAYFEATGDAFEAYVQALLQSIADHDQGGPWAAVASPRDAAAAKQVRDDELADAYLQRGDVGIAVEAKALRFPTDFLSGLDTTTVVGPEDAVLTTLEDSSVPPPPTADLKKGDKGLLTRSMYQQSAAGPGLQAYAGRMHGHAPSRIYPIIVHLAEYRVERTIHQAYIQPLIQRLGLYPQGFWQTPRWMHIEDLEVMAGLAEAGHLNLAAFLEQAPASTRTDQALFEQFSGVKGRPAQLVQDNRALMSSWVEALFHSGDHPPQDAD